MGDDVTYYVRGKNDSCETTEITEKQMAQELTDFIEDQVIPGGNIESRRIGRLCAEYITSRTGVDDIHVHIPNVLSRTLSTHLHRQTTAPHEVEIEVNPKWFRHFIVIATCIPKSELVTKDDYSDQYAACVAASEMY